MPVRVTQTFAQVSKVEIKSLGQSQYVKATLSNIAAKASGSGATAVQNFSSNNACLSCQ